MSSELLLRQRIAVSRSLRGRESGELSRVQTCCAPGPTYILKVGAMPGAGDRVPVQSGSLYRFLAPGVENNRASDVHGAEWIERCTISVEV